VRGALAILLASCSGGDPTDPTDPVDPATDTATHTPVPCTGDAPCLSELQETLFTPTCARGGCHDAATAQSGLVLEDGETWRNLVGVPSVGAPGAVRVDPGAATRSYLVMKLEGAPGIVGVPMPFGTTLDSTAITPVRSWIDAGALDN
jgi:hypothetical protein